MTFRTRLFLTSLASTTVALLVATVLVSYSVRRAMDARIEQSLVNAKGPFFGGIRRTVFVMQIAEVIP